VNGGQGLIKLDGIDKMYLRYKFLTGGDAIESDAFVFSNFGLDHLSV
jgi:hypothetical protein